MLCAITVRMAGFKPTSSWLRAECSTTELQPPPWGVNRKKKKFQWSEFFSFSPFQPKMIENEFSNHQRQILNRLFHRGETNSTIFTNSMIFSSTAGTGAMQLNWGWRRSAQSLKRKQLRCWKGYFKLISRTELGRYEPSCHVRLLVSAWVWRNWGKTIL